MDPKQVASIKQELEHRTTGELIDIWQRHDPDEWTGEAFEAVRQILLARLDALPPQDDRAAADGHIEQAQELLDADQLDQALSECDLAVQSAPHYGLAYAGRGTVLETMGRWQEADTAYRTSLEHDPDLPEVDKRIAEIHDLHAREVEAQRWSNYLEYLHSDEGLEAEGYDPNEEVILRGWPGYRNRRGRSGLDYVDSNAEEGRMEGMFLRGMLTGKLITRNPFYLTLMAVMGLYFSLPLLVLFTPGSIYSFFSFFEISLYSIVGIGLLFNFAKNMLLRKDNLDEGPDSNDPAL